MYDMTNKELAAELARRMKTTPYQALKFLSNLADVVNENADNNDGTKIAGIGTIGVRSVDERVSRDINTGEKIIIPPHRAIRFHIARRLKITMKKEQKI